MVMSISLKPRYDTTPDHTTAVPRPRPERSLRAHVVGRNGVGHVVIDAGAAKIRRGKHAGEQRTGMPPAMHAEHVGVSSTPSMRLRPLTPQ